MKRKLGTNLATGLNGGQNGVVFLPMKLKSILKNMVQRITRVHREHH